MKIEFWLNILNPYSYIAHLQFKSAMKASGTENIAIEYKWFSELSDQASSEQNVWDIKQFYTQAFEQSEVWSQLLFEDFAKRAEMLGKKMQLDSLHLPKVDLPHSIKVAEQQSVGVAFVEFLFSTFWEQGKEITNKSIEDFYKNIDCLNNTNVETTNIKSLLQEDELLTQELGISEAPMMIVNEEIGLCGIQPIEHLVEVISMAQSNQ